MHPPPDSASTSDVGSSTDTSQKDNSAGHRRDLWRRLTPIAGLTAIILGAIVLIGWPFDIAAFKSILPGLPVMVPNTALGLILAGIALWILSRRESTGTLRYIGLACSLVI